MTIPPHRFHTHQEAMDAVVKAKCSSIHSSFLLITIPGADEPRKLLQTIEKRLVEKVNKKVSFALISTDSIDNQEEMVKRAIAIWCRNNEGLKKAWKEELEFESPSSAGQLLQRFGHIAAAEGISLCLLIDKFHKVIRYMSSGFLGTMRDMEQDDHLSFINASEDSYASLYSIRRETQPSFTSDFGQFHSDYILSRLTREEAYDLWKDDLNRAGVDLPHKEIFDVAYSESDGFPTAFKKATLLFLSDKKMDPSSYPSLVQTELIPVFANIINKLEIYDGLPLIEAVASTVTGTTSTTDTKILDASPRAHLFSAEGHSIFKLSCPGIGLAALTKATPERYYGSPELLYEKNLFHACNHLAGATPKHELLCLASKMMQEVFGNDKERKIFRHSVLWENVASLAEKAEGKCTTTIAKSEFTEWKNIARALQKCPRGRPADVAAHFDDLSEKSSQDIIDSVYYLGARYYAVKMEKHPTLSAYLALPLLEGVIKCSLAFIAQKNGGAKNSLSIISDADYLKWKPVSWKKDMEAPKTMKNLGASKACVLLATMSDKSGIPTFSTPSEVLNIIDFFGKNRNPLAHTVVEPDTASTTLLIRKIEEIWKKSIEAESSLSCEGIVSALAPPSKFLKKM